MSLFSFFSHLDAFFLHFLEVGEKELLLPLSFLAPVSNKPFVQQRVKQIKFLGSVYIGKQLHMNINMKKHIYEGVSWVSREII